MGMENGTEAPCKAPFVFLRNIESGGMTAPRRGPTVARGES
jgi:hypothetical protein